MKKFLLTAGFLVAALVGPASHAMEDIFADMMADKLATGGVSKADFLTQAVGPDAYTGGDAEAWVTGIITAVNANVLPVLNAAWAGIGGDQGHFVDQADYAARMQAQGVTRAAATVGAGDVNFNAALNLAKTAADTAFAKETFDAFADGAAERALFTERTFIERGAAVGLSRLAGHDYGTGAIATAMNNARRADVYAALPARIKSPGLFAAQGDFDGAVAYYDVRVTNPMLHLLNQAALPNAAVVNAVDFRAFADTLGLTAAAVPSIAGAVIRKWNAPTTTSTEQVLLSWGSEAVAPIHHGTLRYGAGDDLVFTQVGFLLNVVARAANDAVDLTNAGTAFAATNALIDAMLHEVRVDIGAAGNPV